MNSFFQLIIKRIRADFDKIKTWFKESYSSNETGGLLNYYTLHIRDPHIQQIVTKKWIDKADKVYWLGLLTFLCIICELLHSVFT